MERGYRSFVTFAIPGNGDGRLSPPIFTPEKAFGPVGDGVICVSRADSSQA
jgi:hypothetical protein